MSGGRPRCRRIEVEGVPVLARSVGEPTEEDLHVVAEFAELLRKVTPIERYRDRVNRPSVEGSP